MSLLKRILGIDSGSETAIDSPVVEKIVTSLKGMEKDRAHYLAAFACVLARGANADLRIEDSEVSEMICATSSLGGLADEEARLAVEIALAQAREDGGTAGYLLTREFRSISSKEQRAGLVECLYAVSAADGTISTTESSEVSRIAEELGLTRQETNALKSGWKEHLAEFQGLPKK